MGKIFICPPDKAESIWHLVIEHIAPAIAEDIYHTEQSLKKLVIEDHAILFIAYMGDELKGAAIAQVESGGHRLMNILTLGGKDFMGWKDALNDAITQCAKALNCRYIVATGRKGWQKLWPDFTPGKILYCKEIA